MDSLGESNLSVKREGKRHIGESLYELLNDNGFLTEDAAQWTEELALRIAAREGLDRLDSMHWKIISALRAYYETYQFVPTLRRACRVSGEWENSCLSCFFRGDPLKAVKIAGLPEPGGEVKSYYRGMCRCGRPGARPGIPGEWSGAFFPLAELGGTRRR